jgi:basic membrane lipoprotein Med (substrate-binding protein (PBP1-ABC) superfamily)
VAPTQWLSILKHIDRAVALCVGQWLSPEGMPKHQVLGLKEGYTEVAINSALCDLSLYNEFVPEELRQQIHEDAIRKEAEYDK